MAISREYCSVGYPYFTYLLCRGHSSFPDWNREVAWGEGGETIYARSAKLRMWCYDNRQQHKAALTCTVQCLQELPHCFTNIALATYGKQDSVKLCILIPYNLWPISFTHWLLPDSCTVLHGTMGCLSTYLWVCMVYVLIDWLTYIKCIHTPWVHSGRDLTPYIHWFVCIKIMTPAHNQ